MAPCCACGFDVFYSFKVINGKIASASVDKSQSLSILPAAYQANARSKPIFVLIPRYILRELQIFFHGRLQKTSTPYLRFLF